jgi:hypothetical protein
MIGFYRPCDTPGMVKHPQRTRDSNVLAKLIVDTSVGESRMCRSTGDTAELVRRKALNEIVRLA